MKDLSNEKSHILKEIYEDVEIECSEKRIDDYYGDLKAEMFDRAVAEYINNRYPGYQSLKDYDPEKDNGFN